MSFTATVSLGVGLSMDAFAASLGQGAATSRRSRVSHALKVGLAFGLAQGIMPLIGWGLGVAFHEMFQAVDHWIALVLLTILGVRMMRASLHACDVQASAATGWQLGALAVATSIDAAVAGLTLALLEIPIPIACMIIGVITFLISAGGVLLGRAAGCRLGSVAEVVGGLILIALGAKIFIEHQFLS